MNTLLGSVREHQALLMLQGLDPATEAGQADLEWETCLHLSLCDAGELGAEVRQDGMFLGLNKRVKLRLHFPCGGVQQHGRELDDFLAVVVLLLPAGGLKIYDNDVRENLI